jgi:hypothetical protein
MQLTPFGALLLMVGVTVSSQAASHKAPSAPLRTVREEGTRGR